MKTYLITYKVYVAKATVKKLMAVQAYDLDHAKSKFPLWKGLIIKVEKAN